MNNNNKKKKLQIIVYNKNKLIKIIKIKKIIFN